MGKLLHDLAHILNIIAVIVHKQSHFIGTVQWVYVSSLISDILHDFPVVRAPPGDTFPGNLNKSLILTYG